MKNPDPLSWLYTPSTRKKDVQAYDIDWNRFWSSVQVGPDDRCWPWLCSRNTGGYGLFHVPTLPEDYEVSGRTVTQVMAHRAVASLTGILRPAEYVRHACSCTACCNPRHLRISGRIESVQDLLPAKWQKSRARTPEAVE